MSDLFFPYVGGKCRLSTWIIKEFPKHYCYIDVFGGSAAVLLNKDRSENEIFNDKDEDIVHFFLIYRDREDELIEWLSKTPYSKQEHYEWAKKFYNGERDSDPIKRAGKFFYLRYSQYASKYSGISGWRSDNKANKAIYFENGKDKLNKLSSRFKGVQIENEDYAYILDRYDSEDSFFYLDPPYVDAGDALYSHEGSFDHVKFFEKVKDIKGYWMLSYGILPDFINKNDYYYKEKEVFYSNLSDENENPEIILMNYNPETTPTFQGDNSSILDF